MASGMNIMYLVAGILAAIGALNWGLTGVFDFNLVDKLFGKLPLLEKGTYGLIGVAGLLCLIYQIRWAMSPTFKQDL